MKNILIKIMLILMILIIPRRGYALATSDASCEIDLLKEGTLTLNYNYDDYNFDNTKVNIYYVASITFDFQYQLSSDFFNYPIKINKLKNEEEWTSLKQTIEAYIAADNISAFMFQSISNNKVIFSNLKPGLYFVKTEKINSDSYTLLFDSFLISVPNLDENGSWNYDVSVYPKALEYIPKYEKINYTVIKEWVDNGEKRPKEIEIEIYQDGKKVDNQILSYDNNWTYQWETLDDGSNWMVVERNVPEGYEVSILKKDKNFIVVNTNYDEDNPKTIDDIKLYMYLLLISFIGIILIVIGFIIQRKLKCD